MAFLTRSEPPNNVNRFYLVNVTRSLFGEWTVMREWGRIGSPGTLRLHTFTRLTIEAAGRREGQGTPARARRSGRIERPPASQVGHHRPS